MSNPESNLQKILAVILTVIIASAAIVGGAYAYKIWILPAKNQPPSDTENNNQLIGGQKDEHGCLIAAGYSWCQAKQKCLRVWEEACTGLEDEQGIKQAFVDRYTKPIEDITIIISQNNGDYAFGSVTFGQGGPGEGGYFFAYKKDGKWLIAADGNGSVSCRYLKYYGFPDDMTKDTCYDYMININFTKTGNLAARGEEFGNKAWGLIYEEPGSPALSVFLTFRQDSFCDLGSGEQPCLDAQFEQGQRVKIEGDLQQGRVTVAKLTVIK